MKKKQNNELKIFSISKFTTQCTTDILNVRGQLWIYTRILFYKDNCFSVALILVLTLLTVTKRYGLSSLSTPSYGRFWGTSCSTSQTDVGTFANHHVGARRVVENIRGYWNKCTVNYDCRNFIFYVCMYGVSDLVWRNKLTR